MSVLKECIHVFNCYFGILVVRCIFSTVFVGIDNGVDMVKWNYNHEYYTFIHKMWSVFDLFVVYIFVYFGSVFSTCIT